MRQTIEDAAKEARVASAETLTTYGTHQSLDDFIGLSYDEIAESAFIKGAEWQAKQSPWININDRLPENKDEVLVLNRMNISGKYFVSSDSYDGKEWAVNLAMHYTRVAWMPIPSFDEILEASKDVLQRMKENGD